MPDTIIETILNPKYQNEYNFRNLTEKIKMCEELKRLETEITAQLDREHKRMFAEYAECWDILHTELSLDTFASGMKFAEIHKKYIIDKKQGRRVAALVLLQFVYFYNDYL